MDPDDDYVTMTNEYKIIEPTTVGGYYTSTEMNNEMYISKYDANSDDISGDPTIRKVNGKQIRPTQQLQKPQNQQKNQNKKIQKPSSQQVQNNNTNSDYRICPICDLNVVSTCNCMNHDSVCENGHKWHMRNGVKKLGHTH